MAAPDVASKLGVDAAHGLDARGVAGRLEQYGANALPTEEAPSL